MATIVKRMDPKTQRTVFSSSKPLYVVDNNNRHFVYHPKTNTRYEVTGRGAKNAIEAQYGEPITGVYLTGATRGPNVVDLYGGPNQIEMVVAGRKADPITGNIVRNPQKVTTGHGQTINPFTDTDNAHTRNQARDEIKSTLSHLPSTLLNVAMREWEDTGSVSLAIDAMRNHPKYDEYFPGMRRSDGTIRYNNEAEYQSVDEAFNRYWRSFGTNSDIPTESRRRLHEGDVSPQEWQSRLAQRYAEIEVNMPQIQRYYQENYGATFSSATAFVSSVLGTNPVEAQRQIYNSQIGGSAAQYGFDIRLQEADRLRAFGLDQAGAQRLYAQAQSDLPRLNALLGRHNDPDDDFSLDEFTDAVVIQDATQLRRISQLLANEASFFSADRPFAADQGGALRGLRR